MTPDELTAYLNRIQAHSAELPAQIERSVVADLPRVSQRISVQVLRRHDGVSVTLSGRGARAAGKRLRASAADCLPDLVKGLIRR